MDLGREEFDWDRMRQEEDDYFAVKKAAPKTMETTLKGVLSRMSARAGGEDDPIVAKLRSLPYSEYLATEHWRKTRERALNRDGFQCRICASRKALEVHHLTYERRGEELPTDLITLCGPCHKAQHDRKA